MSVSSLVFVLLFLQCWYWIWLCTTAYSQYWRTAVCSIWHH